LKEEHRFKTWEDLKRQCSIDPFDMFGGLVTNFCDPNVWDLEECTQPPLMSQIQCAKGIYYTVGCHPRYANQVESGWDQKLENIFRMDRFNKCVAVGECGLDRKWERTQHDRVPMHIQKEIFSKQLTIAMKLNVPLVLHIRDAQKEAIEIFDSVGVPITHPVHRHCFDGTVRECVEWLERFPNSVIGFTNLITFTGTDRLKSVVRYLDLSKIVLETDAPYFIPQGDDSGKVNGIDIDSFPPTLGTKNADKPMSQPMNVLSVAAKVAEIKNVTIDEVLRANKRNIRFIYRIRE